MRSDAREIGWAQMRAHAEAAAQGIGNRLTFLREAVLQTLWEARSPMSAYELTNRLNKAATNNFAPNSIYRALDFLESLSLVRKIASRQAFALVPPQTPALPILLTCTNCGCYSVRDGEPIEEALRTLAAAEGFAIDRRIVELTGECVDCQRNRA